MDRCGGRTCARPRRRRRCRARAPLNPAHLTVVVLTRDEERRLPAALASLPPGARIFVLDAESRDATVAIARAYGADVEVRPWTGFVDARRYALARVTTPWTLMLDADERLDATLRAAIAAAGEGVEGYLLRRITTLCGAPIRTAGWSHERLVRLFRTDRATLRSHGVVGGADLHERWHVAPPLGALPGAIVHESYPTLAIYRQKFARYTALEAARTQPSLAALAVECAAFPLRVAWSLLRWAGWRDGWRGLYVAWMSAAYRVAVRFQAYRHAA